MEVPVRLELTITPFAAACLASWLRNHWRKQRDSNPHTCDGIAGFEPVKHTLLRVSIVHPAGSLTQCPPQQRGGPSDA